MAVEIERKYLVHKHLWDKTKPLNGKSIRQCYLFAGAEGSGRVRIKGDKAYLTIKGKSQGLSRAEFEYEIPKTDAEQIMHLFQGKLVEKIRYEVLFGGKIWEVDEFTGHNKGLFLAEIELQSEDETFELPEWAGEEVTLDLKYNNSQLAAKPFSEW